MIAALICALAPGFSPVNAQEQDTQFWVYAVGIKDFEDDLRLTVDASARWREQARGDEQQTLRFNLDTAIADGIRLGGGGGVFEAGGLTELRVHQQMALEFGRFSARTRTEQRFFDGADRMELRLRQRVRYTQPLSQTLSASLDAEYLHIARTAQRGPDQARDQFRPRLILEADLNPRVSLAGTYMVIITPRRSLSDRINHVPQAIVTYRF